MVDWSRNPDDTECGATASPMGSRQSHWEQPGAIRRAELAAKGRDEDRMGANEQSRRNRGSTMVAGPQVCLSG